MQTQPSNRRNRFAPRLTAVRGIVLIEVMVALLLFMLGILGLVGLQSAMTRVQTESKIRADAAYLSTELVGRMWSDLTNFASYDGAGCASNVRCKEWQSKVQTMLPGGTGAVAVTSGTGDVTITISWKLPSGETHSYVTSTTIVTRVT